MCLCEFAQSVFRTIQVFAMGGGKVIATFKLDYGVPNWLLVGIWIGLGLLVELGRHEHNFPRWHLRGFISSLVSGFGFELILFGFFDALTCKCHEVILLPSALEIYTEFKNNYDPQVDIVSRHELQWMFSLRRRHILLKTSKSILPIWIGPCNFSGEFISALQTDIQQNNLRK